MGLADQPVADHRLHGVEPGVAAEDRNLVAVLHAVVADQPQLLVHGVVIGDDHAGIAPDVEVLQRMQREAGGDAVGAGALAGEFGQDALAGVLDDRKIVFFPRSSSA